MALALKDLKAEADPQARWPREKKLLPKRELPKPLYCDAYYCDADDPPACTNFEQNVHGRPGSTIMKPDDPMNPFGTRHAPNPPPRAAAKPWAARDPAAMAAPADAARRPRSQGRSSARAASSRRGRAPSTRTSRRR